MVSKTTTMLFSPLIHVDILLFALFTTQIKDYLQLPVLTQEEEDASRKDYPWIFEENENSGNGN
jgi:hypothetical protein